MGCAMVVLDVFAQVRSYSIKEVHDTDIYTA